MFPDAGSRRYAIAFSGGMDSTSLLAATSRLAHAGFGAALRAIHVDHGLHPESARWARQARQRARALGVECVVIAVDGRPPAGHSREAAARDARYAGLAAVMQDGEILLTAQHLDDQAETVLLQLLRGGGPAGFGAMPDVRAFGPGWLARPLLSTPRATLKAWAEAAGMSWFEDPSNQDLSLDRVHVRQVLLPGLYGRWPGARQTLARAAGHAREAAKLLDDLAAIDRAGTSAGDWIEIAPLAELGGSRARNAIRGWLRSQDMPMPSAVRLRRIANELVSGRVGGQGEVLWTGGGVRRWRGRLFAVGPLSPPPAGFLSWDTGKGPLSLPGELGTLSVRPEPGGLDEALFSLPVSVGWRSGGERLRLRAGGPSRTLKNLFREAGIRPWMRGRIPLIYSGKCLIAAGDLFVAAGNTGGNASGLAVSWTAHPPIDGGWRKPGNL